MKTIKRGDVLRAKRKNREFEQIKKEIESKIWSDLKLYSIRKKEAEEKATKERCEKLEKIYGLKIHYFLTEQEQNDIIFFEKWENTIQAKLLKTKHGINVAAEQLKCDLKQIIKIK